MHHPTDRIKHTTAFVTPVTTAAATTTNNDNYYYKKKKKIYSLFLFHIQFLPLIYVGLLLL